MQLLSIKAALAAGWVLVVFVSGVVAHPNSVASWTVLAGFAVIPPLVMMWWWNDPPQSMSESIQKARR